MIQPNSIVKIADNSGGRVGKVFNILGGTGKRYARLGDIVVLSVQKADPRKTVKKKAVLQGVVVRQRRPFRRKDGSYVAFDDNAVIVLQKGTKEPLANRVFGPIPRELSDGGFQKIVSQAPEVI